MNINLQQLKIQALEEIKKAVELDSLEKIEKKYLGRKGELTLILRGLKNLPIEERKRLGQMANEIKKEIESGIRNQELGIRNQESGIRNQESGIRNQESEIRNLESKEKKENFFDVTLPGQKLQLGHLHPLTQFTRKVADVFSRMGFEVVEGPEVETEEYNFDLLNIPKDHPARDVWDTYYINSKSQIPNSKQIPNSNDQNSKLLLRTHTSPVQLRAMERRKPPVRIIVPGRVFRREATDAGHETTFYQLEGLVIDKGVRLTDLIGILKVFSQAIFGPKTKIRVRPSFFPFTEPSIEVDISCLNCQGHGCSLCGTGWLEVLGAGMVHPKVLENMKVDPEIWTGYAFGMGIDRLMMLYYGIDDVRLSYGGDLRFLRQF